MKKTEEFDFV